MKESKYDINYFLSNPNFISWVKGPNGNLDDFWKKWLKNHPESKRTFYDAKAVLQGIDFKTANTLQNRKEEILGNILKDSVSSRYKQESDLWDGFIKLRPWLLGSAAVIVLFLMGSTFFKNNVPVDNQQPQLQIITKFAPDGERLSFYLPDSTWVTLNSGSTLKYPTQFSGKRREVLLMGEAYFDVKHSFNTKFLVLSGDIVTEVHGTAFNVRAYAGEAPIEVSLARGSVSVHSQLAILKEVSYRIAPGEKLTVNEDFGLSSKTNFDYEVEFGWKDGILVFKDSDLHDFISKIQKWYGIHIQMEGKSEEDWAINGRFKNESLENVLKSLEFSREVAYKIEDKLVTLNFNNN